MPGRLRLNLYLVSATLAIVLFAKFYLGKNEAPPKQSATSGITAPEKVPAPLIPAAPLGPQPDATAPSALSADESDALVRLDHRHAKYLTLEFPALKLIKKLKLARETTISLYDTGGQGEVKQIFHQDVMTSEEWIMANGDSLHREYTDRGRVYALSVRIGEQPYTNFYDPQLQISKKIQKVKTDLYCVKYERGLPISRELGVCSQDDFREYEDQRD